MVFPKKFLDFNLRRFFAALFCLTLFLNSLPARAEEESARVYFFHALKLKEEGDFLGAERLFQKALELDPGNRDFHFELANLYFQGKNLQAARFEYEQTLMLAPAHLPSHYNLGLVYRELGRASEARSEFRKILELDPNHVKAQLQIGQIYAEEGFLEEAREAFEAARDRDPSNPEPKDALDDLARLAQQDRERSEMDFTNSLRQRQSLLNASDLLGSPSLTGDNPARTAGDSGKGAVMQAGMALIQQLLSKRSGDQNDQENQ